MDQYERLVNTLLNELRGTPSPVNLPSPAPTPTEGSYTARGGYTPASKPTTTANLANLPARADAPTLRPPVSRIPTPRPTVRPGGGGLVGAIATGLALGWGGYNLIRKGWEKKQQPIPMTTPTGYKPEDIILPPLKPGEQGFAVPAPLAPPTPKEQPQPLPAEPAPQKQPKVVPVPPIIPLRPETPAPQPNKQPAVPKEPPATPETPEEPDSSEQTRKYIPSPLTNTKPALEPTNTTSGDVGKEEKTPPPGPSNTDRKNILPLIPIPSTPEEIKPGKADDFDFKAYPQGYNPDEPYGRWGPKSASRDTRQTAPVDLVKQIFTGQQPEVTSATPETEAGPWAKRYKRYKDQYEANPKAGQPTTFGNILKKSK